MNLEKRILLSLLTGVLFWIIIQQHSIFKEGKQILQTNSERERERERERTYIDDKYRWKIVMAANHELSSNYSDLSTHYHFSIATNYIYAKENDYDFTYYQWSTDTFIQSTQGERTMDWSKPLAVWHALKSSNRVIWIDADAAMETATSFQRFLEISESNILDPPQYPTTIFVNDYPYTKNICAFFFMMTDESKTLMYKWWNNGLPEFNTGGMKDQAVLNRLIGGPGTIDFIFMTHEIKQFHESAVYFLNAESFLNLFKNI